MNRLTKIAAIAAIVALLPTIALAEDGQKIMT